jgi:hypothetical protein
MKTLAGGQLWLLIDPPESGAIAQRARQLQAAEAAFELLYQSERKAQKPVQSIARRRAAAE